jgi:hypothetical protein
LELAFELFELNPGASEPRVDMICSTSRIAYRDPPASQ